MTIQAISKRLAARAGTLLRPSSRQDPDAVHRIGLFLCGPAAAVKSHQKTILDRLASQGFEEGRNLIVEARTASYERWPDSEGLQDLLATRPEAILTITTGLAREVQQATREIPIVFAIVADPVQSGLVKDLDKPGTNATGVYLATQHMITRQFELLRELFPGIKRVALAAAFYDPGFRMIDGHTRQCAAGMGIELTDVYMTFGWLEKALAAAVRAKPEAVLVLHPVVASGSEKLVAPIIEFAARQRIPSFFPSSVGPELGGLLSYGMNIPNELGRAADQLARVLKGANPADLPVDQTSHFSLVVNLKTARSAGIAIPESIRAAADRLIE